ncbi:autophagy-related protein 2 homolog A-like, partial [Mycteria americana]|uniref:autophagy-related protein 2 homolog A-like n=1 Tax=Mycteria americana TaxID=33587 RepID=UPI003F58668F
MGDKGASWGGDALIFLRDYISSFIAHMAPPAPSPTPPTVPAPGGGTHGGTWGVPLGAGGDTGGTLGAGGPLTPPPPRSSAAPPGAGDPPGLEPLADEDPDSESPVYFREFRFTAEVPIWLDYRGKRVTMEQGALAGILIGLARLNCSQLRLKRLCHRQGLLGLGKVLSFAVTEWLRDIRCHQLPGLLGGVAPVHAVLRLWRALRDLLALPLLPLLGGHPGGVTRGVTQGVTRGGHRPGGRLRLRRHRPRHPPAARPPGAGRGAVRAGGPPRPPRPLGAPPEPPAELRQVPTSMDQYGP